MHWFSTLASIEADVADATPRAESDELEGTVAPNDIETQLLQSEAAGEPQVVDVAPSPLDDLIANRVPIIEEPTSLDLIAKYHGKSIGGRKLIFNGPHAGVPAPHAAFSPSSTDSTRGANSRSRSRRRETVSASSRSTAAGFTPTEMDGPYDTVLPEATEASRRSVSKSASRADEATPGPAPRKADGGLLERVLLATPPEWKQT